MPAGKKDLLKNIASLGVVQIANYLLPIISVPIVSRIIGPEKFGIINYAAAFAVYFNVFIDYGFNLTATRRIAKEPNNTELRIEVFNKVFKAQILLFLLSCLIFLACLYTVPPLALEKKVAVFSFLLCIGTVLTQNWLFQAMQDLPKVALLNFASKFLFTGLIVLMVRKPDDYILQPLLLSLVQIAVAISSFYWAFKRYHLKFIKTTFRSIFQLLWSEKTVFFSMIVISIYTTTNTVILGLSQTAAQVGYYTAGLKLVDVIRSVINVPLAQAMFPFIGKAFGEGRENGVDMAQRMIPIILLFTGSITLLMFLFGSVGLELFYGKAFLPSVPVFKILIFVPVVIALSNVLGIQIMMNLSMDKAFFRITTIGAMLSILLNVLLVKRFGYIGTACNWLFTELFILIAMYFTLKSQGVNPLNKKYLSIKFIKEQVTPLINKIAFKK